MKCVVFAAIVVFANATQALDNPITRVVKLITDLQSTCEKDGKKELAAYDKYACYCEETLAKKAKDISDAKQLIEDLTTKITKLGADEAAHEANIKQTKKDVAQNEESQKDAKALRKKEYSEYDEEKTESEQCLGALEAAIKVLTKGTKAKKTKFLETFQEAQLLSTLGSLRGVLRSPRVHKIPSRDLEIVQQFLDHPDDFLHPEGSMSALQVGNNPFGDYAPQSTQIQGVLKGMYDSFMADLEKANAEESKKQKGFEELMATKTAEEKALKATLTRITSELATTVKDLADSKGNRDDTKEQLEADEEFFAQTKKSCKAKAASWAERTRIRAEELQGIKTAISILTSEDAKATFKNATSTFLQISATRHHATSDAVRHAQAFAQLKALASKLGSTAVAQVAAEVQTGGHFDKVIHMIENMVIKLKEEQKADIAQREECEQNQDENKKNMEDLDFNIKKAKEKLDRLEGTEKELQEKAKKTGEAINATQKTIQEMKDLREKEWGEFSQAMKDDLAAVDLLQQAIESMQKVFKDNDIKMSKHSFLQVGDKPPETWEDEAYGGKKSESTGIVAILMMIKEDLEKEIKNGQQGDAAATLNYRNDMNALEETLDSQEKTKADTDRMLADIERKIVNKEEYKKEQDTDLDGEKDIKKALETDCKWVKTHFDKRKEKRDIEITGLLEAKHFLAGAVVLPPKK